MFFTSLVFIAALALELLGSYISILGLSKNASYILVALAITLDFSKIIIATVLYKQWKNLHGFLKTFLVPSLVFLVLYTSSGAYAFLLQEFSKTTTSEEQVQTKIESFEQEKTKLEARKLEIDKQISQLPPESVVQRKKLTDLFSKELEHINDRTIELDKQIPELKIKNMSDTAQGGTIGSLAKAYGTTPESISKVLVLFMVLVIDPLAIVLLTVANFLVELRKKEQTEALNKKLEIEALLASEEKKSNVVISEQPVIKETKNEQFIQKPIEPTVNEITPVIKPVVEKTEPQKESPIELKLEPIEKEEEKFAHEDDENFVYEEMPSPMDSISQEQRIKEAILGKNPTPKMVKDLAFPPRRIQPENETQDVFTNYEVSDSEVLNLLGTLDEKGFETKKVLEDKLFE